MTHLICYDIENDRLRKKIADKLLEEGLERIQYSVFIGPVSQIRKKALVQWLQERLQDMESPQDRMLILKVNPDHLSKMIILGEISVDIALMIGKKNTLFL